MQHHAASSRIPGQCRTFSEFPTIADRTVPIWKLSQNATPPCPDRDPCVAKCQPLNAKCRNQVNWLIAGTRTASDQAQSTVYGQRLTGNKMRSAGKEENGGGNIGGGAIALHWGAGSGLAKKGGSALLA